MTSLDKTFARTPGIPCSSTKSEEVKSLAALFNVWQTIEAWAVLLQKGMSHQSIAEKFDLLHSRHKTSTAKVAGNAQFLLAHWTCVQALLKPSSDRGSALAPAVAWGVDLESVMCKQLEDDSAPRRTSTATAVATDSAAAAPFLQ